MTQKDNVVLYFRPGIGGKVERIKV